MLRSSLSVAVWAGMESQRRVNSGEFVLLLAPAGQREVRERDGLILVALAHRLGEIRTFYPLVLGASDQRQTSSPNRYGCASSKGHR